MPVPVVELNAKLGASLAAGHPWIYKNHVPARYTLAAGWVRVVVGEFSGYAIWDPDSVLALRVFSRTSCPDAAWIQARVAEAFSLRADLIADGRTTAYRLISGEGDYLPGVVVDVYEGFAVVVLDSPALTLLVPDLITALNDVLSPRGILLKQRKEAGEPKLVAGSGLPNTLVVSENGLRLRANLLLGQKTGLFLDHRDNRQWVEQHAEGKRVLNLFAYSGAFSLYAARGGALHVTSVDIAPDAISDARENFLLNGMDPDAHDFVTADVFTFLKECVAKNELFDLVIVDPPSFARRIDQLGQAKRAYLSLNTLACRVVQAGGILASGSCTARVSPEDFRGLVAEAATQCERRFQILREAAHAQDHPIAAGHPEGRYLKFLAGRVLLRA